MQPFRTSMRSYETWLRNQLGGALIEKDLERKHHKMEDSAFAFLRATYWRWAETILRLCPELAAAPQVLAIGDTHLENFGTWRDLDGRLIWGANDFDDAAVMPYALDLVRLAASALLARNENWPDKRPPSGKAICHAIAAGYARGLAVPAPVVIEREHADLRRTLMLSREARKAFWDGTDKWRKAAIADPPPDFARALRLALPSGHGVPDISPRRAGTGSLGRPRFVAQAAWCGGPVLREAKAMVPSGWEFSHAERTALHAETIARGRARAPDPHYRLLGQILVRRLSPNTRKIEARTDPHILLAPHMLQLMGHELANCHADDPANLDAIRSDFAARNKGDWLAQAAEKAAAFVEADRRAHLRHA